MAHILAMGEVMGENTTNLGEDMGDISSTANCSIREPTIRHDKKATSSNHENGRTHAYFASRAKFPYQTILFALRELYYAVLLSKHSRSFRKSLKCLLCITDYSGCFPWSRFLPLNERDPTPTLSASELLRVLGTACTNDEVE
jgi:hypothetical protein